MKSFIRGSAKQVLRFAAKDRPLAQDDAISHTSAPLELLLSFLCAALFSVLGIAWLMAQSVPPGGSATEAMYRAALSSAQRKFDYVEENARRRLPDQSPTVFTEREINAYVNSNHVQLPKGVRRVRFSGTPAVITANALVDFDVITAERRSSNPLLRLFNGVHEVEVVAYARGRGGIGRVEVDSVSLDGVGVPRMALEFFVDRYLTPKYPNIGLECTFRLPARVDTATVGDRTLSVTQK